MVKNSHFRQFLLFVFALIIPCFALWTVFTSAIAMPVVGLVDMILGGWFPSMVEGLFMEGADTVLATEFGELNGRMVPPEQSEYQLAFLINPAIVSYSLPFYATLHFATNKRAYLSSFISGVLILYPFILIGLLSLCLKELMVNLGMVFFEQPGIWVPNGTVIALLYQLNVLIIPTVAPILLWAWQSRETPLMQGLLGMNQQAKAQSPDA